MNKQTTNPAHPVHLVHDDYFFACTRPVRSVFLLTAQAWLLYTLANSVWTINAHLLSYLKSHPMKSGVTSFFGYSTVKVECKGPVCDA